jgi:hypothetical protein
MEFKKYIHLERFGNDEVQGIELGECYVFPKIDGTNASVWFDGNSVHAGSRKRHLTVDSDNAGFCEWVNRNPQLMSFMKAFPNIRLYGEWLVPHSLKTYREDAWRKFYVFDAQYLGSDEFIHYGEYANILMQYGIDYIPPICIMNNATYDGLIKELDNNVFLISEGKGTGEGIVLKNYGYQNRFGRVCWAKMVTNSFKEKHTKEMGAIVKNCKQMVEQEICDTYVNKHLVDKTYAKIVNEMEGWQSRYIPRLLSTVYYDLVNEELWNAVKKMKNPTINFKTLNTLTIMKIKELRPELFS